MKVCTIRWRLGLLLLGGFLAASVPAGAVDRVTVTDALGRKVSFPREPARIISLAPSVTEILFALGLDRRIVGVSDADDYPLEKVTGKPRIGGVQLNIERITSLRPDLIIGVPSIQASQIERLAAMGLPVLAVDANSISETYAQITLIGTVTGSAPAAGRLTVRMRARQRAVEDVVRGRVRPRVYVEISGEPLITAAKGTSIDDLVRRAGGANIFTDLRGWPQVSAEAVVERNPDIIVSTHSGRQHILSRRGWGGVAAVRTGRVVMMEAALLSRPGPRIVDGLSQLAKLLHPGAFP